MIKLIRLITPRFLIKIVKRIVGFTKWTYLQYKIRGNREKTNTCYPTDIQGQEWYSRLMFPDEDYGYCAQFYNVKWKSRPKYSYHPKEGAEIIFAKAVKEEIMLDLKHPAILPVAVKRNEELPEVPIDIYVNDAKYGIDGFDVCEEQYYYFRFPENAKIKIAVNGGDLFVGKPVALEQKHPLKLVLPIFVDGLGQDFFKYESFEKLMPNTHEFFKGGTRFTNCYTNGEWSLPSIASIVTGQRTFDHGMFHPLIEKLLNPNDTLLSEHFQTEGFYCSQIGSNWQKNPSLGYARGFDRTVYDEFMDVSEIINAFIDQMEGFKELSQFCWLTIFDLHHTIKGISTVDVSANTRVEHFASGRTKEKSVRKDFNENTIRQKLEVIRRIDRCLGNIYEYITKNYSKSEYLVVLFADHGQSYLSRDSHILSPKITNTPLMFKGRGVSSMESTEYVQNSDILSILHHLAHLNTTVKKLDGRIPKVFGGSNEREFVFSESIFPGQTYKATYRGDEGEFTFESKTPLPNDGIINFEDIELKETPIGDTLAGRDANFFEKDLKAYLMNSKIYSNQQSIK